MYTGNVRVLWTSEKIFTAAVDFNTRETSRRGLVGGAPLSAVYTATERCAGHVDWIARAGQWSVRDRPAARKRSRLTAWFDATKQACPSSSSFHDKARSASRNGTRPCLRGAKVRSSRAERTPAADPFQLTHFVPLHRFPFLCDSQDCKGRHTARAGPENAHVQLPRVQRSVRLFFVTGVVASCSDVPPRLQIPRSCIGDTPASSSSAESGSKTTSSSPSSSSIGTS
jgi:hypothetical protein